MSWKPVDIFRNDSRVSVGLGQAKLAVYQLDGRLRISRIKPVEVVFDDGSAALLPREGEVGENGLAVIIRSLRRRARQEPAVLFSSVSLHHGSDRLDHASHRAFVDAGALGNLNEREALPAQRDHLDLERAAARCQLRHSIGNLCG